MMVGIKRLSLFLMMIAITSCNGVMGGLYDDEDVLTQDDGKAVVIDNPETDVQTVSGTVFVDASSWKDWYYVDFHALHDRAVEGVEEEVAIAKYPISTTLTGDWDGESMMCNYWYDVFGEGMHNNHFVSSVKTDAQEEPENWDIALHRNNVRTNGAAVYETTLQNIGSVGAAADYEAVAFTEDELNETDVWADPSQMLSGQIGNQRIRVNSILSGWLRIDIPPMPPAFTHNGNVYVVRFKDQTYAAIRLKDFRRNGTNCCMTIEYTYPLK